MFDVIDVFTSVVIFSAEMRLTPLHVPFKTQLHGSFQVLKFYMRFYYVTRGWALLILLHSILFIFIIQLYILKTSLSNQPLYDMKLITSLFASKL
jgi:hypothetical protein